MIQRLDAEPIEHIVLYNVSWDLYERLLEAMGDRRFRHSYDDGVLEIMTPSKRHDREKSFIGRLVEAVALEWDVDIDAIGSTTLREAPKTQGLEPDECFYIAHAKESQGYSDFDPQRDPPPDLAIEVDVTNSSVGRMPIYARLGVPELWRFADGRLTFYRLAKGKKYVAITHSKAFPNLPSRTMERFVRQLGSKPVNSIVREFMEWLRANRP